MLYFNGSPIDRIVFNGEEVLYGYFNGDQFFHLDDGNDGGNDGGNPPEIGLDRVLLVGGLIYRFNDDELSKPPSYLPTY